MVNSGLTPVAIKERATRKTFTLIDHSYMQTKEIALGVKKPTHGKKKAAAASASSSQPPKNRS